MGRSGVSKYHPHERPRNKHVLEQGMSRRVLILQRRDDLMQRALFLFRCIIDDLGLLHLSYRDEELDVFDLSTRETELRVANDKDEDGEED
jgi:hypothetical protein